MIVPPTPRADYPPEHRPAWDRDAAIYREQKAAWDGQSEDAGVLVVAVPVAADALRAALAELPEDQHDALLDGYLSAGWR